MQIYAYPGDRLDFISKTSSAGALEFGDPVGLVEEFFGAAHTKTPLENEAGYQELTYYNGSLSFEATVGKPSSVPVQPSVSKEKIHSFVARERVSGPARGAAPDRTKQVGVEGSSGEVLENVHFPARNNSLVAA